MASCRWSSRGTGPRATVRRTSRFIVGRGPVPRHRSRNPTIAGDRPPPYGSIETRRSLLPESHLLQDKHLPRGGEIASGERIEIHPTRNRLTHRVFAIPIRRTTADTINSSRLMPEV